MLKRGGKVDQGVGALNGGGGGLKLLQTMISIPLDNVRKPLVF